MLCSLNARLTVPTVTVVSPIEYTGICENLSRGSQKIGHPIHSVSMWVGLSHRSKYQIKEQSKRCCSGVSPMIPGLT